MYYTTYPPDRDEFIRALRDLADFLAAHPGVPVPKNGAHILLHASSTDDGGRDQVNHIACQLGVTITDDTPGGGHFRASRPFGPLVYEAIAITTAYTALYEARHSYDGCVTPDA